MGQVYACEHVEVGRQVAVKVLQPWLAQHPVADRLRVEARAASAAGHPNIVDVFDAGKLDDGRPFIAMEFLDGETLHESIQRAGSLSLERAVVVGAAIARALEAAHGAGIIHRDLKPENVMLVQRGRERVVKVVDFGIAFDVAAVGRRTHAGVAIGTPHYMAPEQALGASGTPALDIYALGVILFEMVSGELPLDGPDPAQLLELKLSAVAPRLETQLPQIPTWYADLVSQCLERERGLRPATAGEVAERLERGRVTEVSDLGAVATRELPSTPPRSRSPWLIGSVLALTAAVGLGAWWSQPQVSAVAPSLPQIAVPQAPQATQPPLVDEARLPEAPQEEPVEAVQPPKQPAPEAKPAPVQKAQDKPRALPQVSAEPRKPDAPASAKVVTPAPKCEGVETRARQARSKHLWGPVLEEVTKTRCWSSNTERIKLHVLALKELGRFAACAKAARGSQDAEVQSWGTLCQKRAEQ